MTRYNEEPWNTSYREGVDRVVAFLLRAEEDHMAKAVTWAIEQGEI